MEEIWKPIENYENLYEVSTLGRIRSLYNYRGKYHILKPRLKKGYLQIGLRKHNKRCWYAVHRIVSKAFIPNPNNLPCVNHKNQNKLDNSVSNLEWCTYHYNNVYGDRIQKCIEKTGKPVIKYDMKGTIIERYVSASEAARQNCCDLSQLTKCCRGLIKTVKGFSYTYEREVM